MIYTLVKWVPLPNDEEYPLQIVLYYNDKLIDELTCYNENPYQYLSIELYFYNHLFFFF